MSEVRPAINPVSVEAAALILRLDAPLTVVRAGETDGLEEEIAPGAEVTLGPKGHGVPSKRERGSPQRLALLVVQTNPSTQS